MLTGLAATTLHAAQFMDCTIDGVSRGIALLSMFLLQEVCSASGAFLTEPPEAAWFPPSCASPWL